MPIHEDIFGATGAGRLAEGSGLNLRDLLFGTESEVGFQQEGTTTTTQQEQLNQLLLALQGESGQISGMAGAESALERALSGEPQDIDEYFRTAIQEPMVRQFREEIFPSISKRFGSEFFGGERQAAEQKAITGLGQSLVSERSRVAQNAREQALARMMQAMGIPFQQQTNLRQQLLQGSTAPTLENISTVTPGQPGVLQSFLGGAGAGLGQSLAGSKPKIS